MYGSTKSSSTLCRWPKERMNVVREPNNINQTCATFSNSKRNLNCQYMDTCCEKMPTKKMGTFPVDRIEQSSLRPHHAVDGAGMPPWRGRRRRRAVAPTCYQEEEAHTARERPWEHMSRARPLCGLGAPPLPPCGCSRWMSDSSREKWSVVLFADLGFRGGADKGIRKGCNHKFGAPPSPRFTKPSSPAGFESKPVRLTGKTIG